MNSTEAECVKVAADNLLDKYGDEFFHGSEIRKSIIDKEEYYVLVQLSENYLFECWSLKELHILELGLSYMLYRCDNEI